MLYTFFNFTLDTDKRELSANDKIISLTKQGYELLLLFVANTGKVFSKDDIIDKVWNGRYVTENSIDQSVSKLRKVLNSIKKETYIKTAYGKGFMFVPQVVQIKKPSGITSKSKTPYRKLVLFVTLVVAFITGLFIFNAYKPSVKDSPESLLLLMTSANNSGDNSWLNQSSVTFIDQVFGFANVANLKNFQDKPKYQGTQQYIESQWRLSPDLKVATIDVTKKEDVFIVELSVVDKLQLQYNQSFSNKNLGLAIKTASKWLAEKVNSTSVFTKIDSLIPQDSYIVELYMRGLTSYAKGQFAKAEHFFQLCIKEKPDFYLARLQLAKVKKAQGKHGQSLAILDTLAKIDVFPQIEIEIEDIRGSIYDIQGKYEQARDLYLAILDKFAGQNIPQLNNIRYNLSDTYIVLTDHDKALTELNKLEASVVESQNPELLAHTLQKKASILQNLGHTKLAQQSAEKSLKIFSNLEDLLGEAKIYSTLARITTHQSKYKESIQYLERSLAISTSLDYKLGIGATLNELIYVLMVQGDFSKAWQANIEMQKIAIDIDYNAMLQSSKQYATDISRAQNKWKRAEIYLQEHLQLAQASNNVRALLKNKLLALDLFLDQNKTVDVEALVKEVQEYIDKTGEIRLQPRIDTKLARYYFLTNKKEMAIALLLSTREMALKTEDGETIIEINNLLAQYYLELNQPQKALAILEEILEYDPLPYPFLLLKSKANYALGNFLQALDLANEGKNTSNEYWQLDDERYLLQLTKEANQLSQ